MTRNFLDLIVVLTQKEMKVRYKSSFLGYVWSVLNPLTLALVYFFAFKIIMRVKIENYSLYLIAGLFPWQLFANSVNASAVSFLGNSSLIKKTVFPRDMIVYSLVSSELLHFVLSIPVIVLFLFLHSKAPSPMWLVGLPLLVLCQVMLVCGLSLAVASVNLFFRDLERLVAIFTNLFFFLTPIVYSFDMIPARYQKLIMYNPLAPLILAYQDLFLTGTFNVRYFFMAFGWGAAALFLGYLVYFRLKWRLAEVL